MRGDKLTFINAMNHSIGTNKTKPTLPKTDRYAQIHQQEIKTRVKNMLDEGIIF